MFDCHLFLDFGVFVTLFHTYEFSICFVFICNAHEQQTIFFIFFGIYSKDRKMALLQLSSVDEAVLALMKMHNYQLSDSNHLRVSFSKSNI